MNRDPRRFRPRLEHLEDRITPAAFADDFSGGLVNWTVRNDGTSGQAAAVNGEIQLTGSAADFTMARIERGFATEGDFVVSADFTQRGQDGAMTRYGLDLAFANGGRLVFHDTDNPVAFYVYQNATVIFAADVNGLAGHENAPATLTVSREGATVTCAISRGGVTTTVFQSALGLGELTGVSLDAWAHQTAVNAAVDNFVFTADDPPEYRLTDDFSTGLNGWTPSNEGTQGQIAVVNGAAEYSGPPSSFTAAALRRNLTSFGDFTVSADFTQHGSPDGMTRYGFELQFDGGRFVFHDTNQPTAWYVYVGNDVVFAADVNGTAGLEETPARLQVARHGRTLTTSVIRNGVETIVSQHTLDLGTLRSVGLNAWCHDTPLAVTVDDFAFHTCTVTWDGGGDNVHWTDPLNWNTDALPGPCADVYIDTSPSVTVVHPAGAVSIHSLHSNNAIDFTGALTLAADSEVNAAFDFDGTLDMGAGLLALQGGGDIGGGITAGAGAAVAFQDGVFRVVRDTDMAGGGRFIVGRVGNAPGNPAPILFVQAQSLRVAELVMLPFGTLDGVGNVTVTRKADWTGGTIKGAGTIQIEPAASMAVGGGGAQAKNLDGRALENRGSIVLDGAGTHIRLSNGATIRNEFGATLELRANASLLYGAGAVPTVTNEGTVRKSGDVSAVQVNFNNQGLVGRPGTVVDVVSGTLQFGASGTHAVSQFTVAANAAIEYTASVVGVPAVQTLGQLTGYDGDGFVRVFNTARLIVVQNAEVTMTNLSLTSAPFPLLPLPGFLSGAGTLRCLDNFIWMAGALQNLNLFVNVGRMQVMGDSEKLIDSSRLRNKGTVEWTGGNFRMTSASSDTIPPRPSEIRNLGRFDAQGDHRIVRPGQGPIGAFVNEGLGIFEKSGGNGRTIVEVPFFNGGTALLAVGVRQVELADGLLQNNGRTTLASNMQGTGTLTVAGDFIQLGESSHTNLGGGTITVSGAFRLQRGAVDLAGGTLAAAQGVELSGTLTKLAGAGTIRGNVTNGAALNVGGEFRAGLLTIEGSYTQTPEGALVLDIFGNQPLTQYDRLHVVGVAEFEGLLVIRRDGFEPAVGATFRVVTSDAQVAGAFSNENSLAPPGPNRTWNVIYDNTDPESALILKVQ